MKLPKLVITDIDGVMTDGGMYYTDQGDAMKRFNVRDGWGVIFLRKLGIPVAIMTGERTAIVAKRAEKLKIEHCYLGVSDKLETAKALCGKLGISIDEVAFIGDDINDLQLLRHAGISGTPGDAPDYVKKEACIVTTAKGGQGAFREFVEKILADNGLLDKAIASCL